MDRILVFKRGRIVEEGAHADLLRRERGVCLSLFEKQAGEFSRALELV